MALGTNNTTAAVANNFIPELWSDEVIGAYKSNLVIANLVTKLSHKGKKGDTIIFNEEVLHRRCRLCTCYSSRH